MKEELTPADYLYSIKIASVLGFLAGWAIGVGLLLYVDNEQFNSSGAIVWIPLLQGIGWSIYGFIVGGSGMFAHLGRKKEAASQEPLTEKQAA